MRRALRCRQGFHAGDDGRLFAQCDPGESVGAGQNLNELIAESGETRKYSFAGPGIGSTPHLSGELFKLKFGLDLVHVPFGGAGPAIQSTVAAHTPVAFTALPAALQQVKEGNLRALAIMATKRVAALPGLPTTAEAGVPDQESTR